MTSSSISSNGFSAGNSATSAQNATSQNNSGASVFQQNGTTDASGQSSQGLTQLLSQMMSVLGGSTGTTGTTGTTGKTSTTSKTGGKVYDYTGQSWVIGQSSSVDPTFTSLNEAAASDTYETSCDDTGFVDFGFSIFFW